MLSFESLFNISLCCIKWRVRHAVWSPGEPGAAGAAAGAGAGPGAALPGRLQGQGDAAGSRGALQRPGAGPGGVRGAATSAGLSRQEAARWRSRSPPATRAVAR